MELNEDVEQGIVKICGVERGCGARARGDGVEWGCGARDNW